jgi:hypothetical protein
MSNPTVEGFAFHPITTIVMVGFMVFGFTALMSDLVRKNIGYNGLLVPFLRKTWVLVVSVILAWLCLIAFIAWCLYYVGMLASVISSLVTGFINLALIVAFVFLIYGAWRILIEGKQPTEPTPTISTEIPPAERKSWMD